MRMDYHKLRRLSVGMILVAIALLLATLIPGLGVERNGATRWLDLGFIEIQPSEFAKLALIVYISAWASWPRSKYQAILSRFRALCPCSRTCRWAYRD